MAVSVTASLPEIVWALPSSVTVTEVFPQEPLSVPLALSGSSAGAWSSSGRSAFAFPRAGAALSGAAVLGAPLMHDFCVISLSDLLTPWETIEKRLRCAAQGDFSLVLYNPGSKKRTEHLCRACDILLEDKDPATLCGWVRNIGREGTDHALLTLEQLRDFRADMFTTVFIGNRTTKAIDGRMVTPRGYENKT